jgi:hypothetical protein
MECGGHDGEPPSLLLTPIRYKPDSVRRSYMVERDNSDTPNWQIGNTFENVSTLFAHVKPMTIVRRFPP